MSSRAITLCLLLAAIPVLGAAPLEALRETARTSRDELGRLKAEQLDRRSELATLSQRIEGLKSGAKGRLLRGAELDGALKKSQELSARLTELARAVASRQGELDATSQALVAALTDEMSRLRAEFDRQPDRAARHGVLERLRELRAERESVRASLSVSALPNLEAPKATDDPEELLEQADLLRDHQQKLAKQLKGLELRIAERRQEADLDRRVERFLREESMFDDQDRRLRVERVALTAQAAGADSSSAAPGTGGSDQPRSGDTTVAGPDTAPGSSYPGTDVALSGAAQGAAESFTGGVRVTHGVDAHPLTGADALPVDLDHGDLGRLEQERKRLQALGEDLGRKAAALEARATQLH